MIHPSILTVRMLMIIKPSQSYAVIILTIIIVLSEIVIKWRVLRMPPKLLVNFYSKSSAARYS